MTIISTSIYIKDDLLEKIDKERKNLDIPVSRSKYITFLLEQSIK